MTVRLAIDAAGHPTPAVVKQLGYVAIIQYSPSTNAMPPTYPARCLAAEIPLITAWEITPTAGQGGAAAGAADAATALACAARDRQPKGTAIYAAIDFEPEGAQLTEVVAYAKAWTAGLHAGGYLSGLYGGIGTIQAVRGSVDKLWQCYAWSSGAVTKGLALYQSQPAGIIDGVPCNEDQVLGTPGAWDADGPVYFNGPGGTAMGITALTSFHADQTDAVWTGGGKLLHVWGKSGAWKTEDVAAKTGSADAAAATFPDQVPGVRLIAGGGVEVTVVDATGRGWLFAQGPTARGWGVNLFPEPTP
jgi:Domain of unknown function (DUF1906)